jgi:hypothetical protein
MSDFGALTLYREKSVVHRYMEELVDDEVGEDRPVLEVRSNRITIPVKTKVSTVHAVVRGQNIPSTMRMSAIVLDEIRRDANVLRDGGGVDWFSMWRRRVSKYENDYNPANWVSVHIGGEEIFSSREDNAAIREIEHLAVGEETSNDLVLEAVQNVLGALEDFAVEHDSQTAFVMTPGADGHRASIMERRAFKSNAFSMQVKHPTPATPVRLSHFMNMSADVMELLTLKSFLDRVQEMAQANTLNKSNITPTQIQMARARKQSLIEGIAEFEKVNKPVYRPERPNFN